MMSTIVLIIIFSFINEIIGSNWLIKDVSFVYRVNIKKYNWTQ